MNKRILDFYESLPGEHKELAKFVEHSLQAIDHFIEEHNQVVYIENMYGHKPSKEEEQMFNRTARDIKALLIAELEKTVQDFEHRGDKNWSKHYKDGII